MEGEPGRLQSMGSLRVGHDWATSLSCIGEGNGTPLQCSCLENPRDGGAWWAAVYGVPQSRTRLKRLSSSSSPRDGVREHSGISTEKLKEDWWVPRKAGLQRTSGESEEKEIWVQWQGWCPVLWGDSQLGPGAGWFEQVCTRVNRLW